MALIKYNNLGNFADVSAVWSKHPEGGREGDFVIIDKTTYYWDKYSRSWVTSGGQGQGGPTTETVDGDLNVGGNLHVGGDAEFEGDVTIKGELHLPNGDRYKGQSSFKSLVFTRADERPDTPTGGRYANPLPDGNVWKDGIPAGTKPIWMSSRIFTSDNQAPATPSWSVPALMSDAEDFDVEFSPAPKNTVPPAPVSGVNGNLGWLWFDPVRNPNADWNSMNWMATRSKAQGTWSDWTIILIKGEDGDGVQSVFTVTDGSTPSISGSSYPPSGWYKSVDSLTVGQGDVLWMSERRFENGAWSAWSAPIRLNGVDGIQGEDGTDIEFIYKRMNRLPDSTDSAPTNQRDQPDYVPRSEGWDDNPSGVDAQHKYEWACQRTKSGRSELWSEWVGPFVWSAFGERGMDGDGVEYVFIRTTVFTPPTITESAVQEAEHLPEVANYSSSYDTGEIDGNTFFDNPKGVNSTWLYEWVSKRKKVNGEWGAFSSPGLWATYSEQHTIDIDPVTGCWIIDGNLTDKKAIGQGVTVRGRVDVYLESETTTEKPKSLEYYPLHLTGYTLAIGDCWIVETGTGVAGHLFLCVATTGTMSAMWQDLGEFKGEPGQSQYMHLAWASKINFTGNPQQFSSADGFTKDYVAGQSYDWMGVTVDANESDATLEAVNYKWNYLKGKDGSDVEYVYLRTKVNTAPTITEAAVQTPERYPAVANYSSYAAGDVEHDTFTDDPNGVNDPWKYEWVSRREKSYNPTTGKMEWGAFLSPARLWSNWADPGAPGESATIIKPSVSQIVIDTNANGDVPVTQQTKTVMFRLFYGKTQVTPTSYSATYGGTAVSNIHLYTTSSDPRVSVVIALPSTGATTKDIVVNMSYGAHSASITVPVIINRAGQNGRDVYKSIVFMRSVSKPTKPDASDGSYSSPVPSGTYNDNGTTRQWKDGVDTGTLPVWMTSRIFYSDGQPSGDSWADVVLMQDTDIYDVEFTDADLESSPGTPDLPATGVTWYDPVDDASYLSSHAMNWMAQRVKVVTANGTSWGNWVVNKIRGEKGNDGAGQAYVRVDINQVVIDCDSTGKPKTAKTGDNAIKVNAKLYWGDEPCSMITVTPSGSGGNYSIISVDCDGFNLAMPGQTGSTYQITKSSSNIEVKLNVKTSAAISSGNIIFTLVGTDSNSVEHVATMTVPIIANVQGATGNTGPVLRFRGEYSQTVDQSGAGYVWNDTYRDCVKYDGSYYLVNTSNNGGTPLGTPSAQNDKWMSAGANLKFFATELLLAENGAINLLSSNVINLFNSQNQIVAKLNGDGEGSYRTYYPDTGRLRKDDNADGWTYYYNNDTDNTLAWMLGPSGVIIRTGTVTMSKIMMSESAIAQAGDLISYNPNLNVTVVDRYVFTNESSDNNGKVYMTGAISNNEPAAGNTVVPNGIYSQAGSWGDMYDQDEDKYYHFLPLVRVANGKIVDKWDERIEYQNPL